MEKFLKPVKSITKISGAIDILFEDNLRVWFPPNFGAPFFTQPNNWLIDKSIKNHKLRFLNKNELAYCLNLLNN